MRGRVYGVSFTRWPSPFIANLLNETCRAYIVRLLVPFCLAQRSLPPNRLTVDVGFESVRGGIL